jgi:hypothetical protein
MTGKSFMRAVTRGDVDILQVLLSILEESRAPYCVIGGLAVNAYAEPVVSLDLDLAVISSDVARISAAAQSRGMTVQRFEHRVNLSLAGSDLRIQLQTDPRYEAFVGRAQQETVLGYRMFVASLEDVLQGKLWAWSDPARRGSKRQKDLADILRLLENHPGLKVRLPPEIVSRMDA